MAEAVYCITGGSGSLGTALVHTLLAQGHKVRTISRNEHKITALQQGIPQELRSRLSTFVGDVRDRYRLWRAFQGVDYVIHGAAMKEIGRCEYDPAEAVKTNIYGTQAVAEASLDAKVKRAVFISSDKACSPVNLYGMTKATGEKLWLASNRYSAGIGTEFVAVRYGNVFSTTGSVLPVWDEQIKRGPLKVTDPECTRFHFRVEGAVRFVLQALGEAKVGELWVPMLPSYRLRDLAEAYAPGHARETTGLTLGEKRHECMVNREESVYAVKEDGHWELKPGEVRNGEAFEYTSGANTWRLSVEDLRKEIAWLTTQRA